MLGQDRSQRLAVSDRNPSKEEGAAGTAIHTVCKMNAFLECLKSIWAGVGGQQAVSEAGGATCGAFLALSIPLE